MADFRAERYLLVKVTDPVHDLADLVTDMREHVQPKGKAQLVAGGLVLDVEILADNPVRHDGFGRIVAVR